MRYSCKHRSDLGVFRIVDTFSSAFCATRDTSLRCRVHRLQSTGTVLLQPVQVFELIRCAELRKGIVPIYCNQVKTYCILFLFLFISIPLLPLKPRVETREDLGYFMYLLNNLISVEQICEF